MLLSLPELVHADEIVNQALKKTAITLGICFGGAGAIVLLLYRDNPGARLTVTPKTINFGNQAVGAGATQIIEIGNKGGSGLSVESVSIDGDNFSVAGPSDLPKILLKGEKLRVEVKAIPRKKGLCKGALKVQYVGKKTCVSRYQMVVKGI
jgi:hypothetical protein